MTSFPDYLAREQASHGLPREPMFERRIILHPPTETLVLSCVLRRKGAPFPQLYIRGIHEDKYTCVARAYQGEIGVGTPVLSGDATVFFVVTQYDFGPGEDDVTMEEVGVGKLDLRSRHTDLWDRRGSESAQVFIAELIGANSSGDVVYAVAGFAQPERRGPLEYFVVRLDWRWRTVEKVASFASVFY
jgi:hypothetical protein